MVEANRNIWKVLTISLGVLFLVALIAYLTLVYALPASGYAIDFPLLTTLGRGIVGLVIGVLIMVVIIAFPIGVFVFTAILLGFGFGIGISATPVGKAIMQLRR
jgi:hypothetical protein